MSKRRECDHCGSTMFLNGRTWLKEKSGNGGMTKKFRVDIGCALLLEERGVLKLKGQDYILSNNTL